MGWVLSTDSSDSFIRNPGPVEPVEDLRHGQMNRRGPLKVIEEENHLHPGRAGLQFSRINGTIQGAFDLLGGIRAPGIVGLSTAEIRFQPFGMKRRLSFAFRS
jgi:hypothetical protein